MWLVVMAGIAFALPNAAFGAAVDTGSATKFTVNSDTTNYCTYAIAGLAGGKTGVINKEGSVYSYRIYSATGSLLQNVNLSSVMNGRESHFDLLHAYGLANGRSLITWEGKKRRQLRLELEQHISVCHSECGRNRLCIRWAKDAVNDMGSRMIVLGDANGLFNPDQAITRAEFAATLVRALGLNPESGSSAFADVGKTDWYYEAVNAAYRDKMISGYADGTFRPNDRITREQAMSMLARAMEITGLQTQNGDALQDARLSAYADADRIAGWAREGVLTSIGAELVHGRSDGRLAPKEFVTRAEVASMVERLLGRSELI
ncbi:S-layer homology domain-containing protein [Paenibacillus glycinis]|uniref:SLH domain-containing protein n=1 Tax=Paenibacillus glycinis TaxID=2697035 RepID=A0ABW9XRS7_9BACL|nr:S-layer homology domain-containing protein [Paenibacillus glycinis]NBD25354.1 hypothetical protein [Paenibacillus glycinis]